MWNEWPIFKLYEKIIFICFELHPMKLPKFHWNSDVSYNNNGFLEIWGYKKMKWKIIYFIELFISTTIFPFVFQPALFVASGNVRKKYNSLQKTMEIHIHSKAELNFPKFPQNWINYLISCSFTSTIQNIIMLHSKNI